MYNNVELGEGYVGGVRYYLCEFQRVKMLSKYW